LVLRAAGGPADGPERALRRQAGDGPRPVEGARRRQGGVMTETREEHDVAGSIGDDPSTVSFAGTSVWRRLYYGETAIDFFGMRWKAIIASALLVVITGVSLFTRGLDLSLEFV